MILYTLFLRKKHITYNILLNAFGVGRVRHRILFSQNKVQNGFYSNLYWILRNKNTFENVLLPIYRKQLHK